VLSDGSVLVVGGVGEVTLTEAYDPETGTWEARAELNQPRYLHTAALLADGTLMVTGGIEGREDGRRSDTAEIYDPVQDVWITGGGEPNEAPTEEQPAGE